MLPISTPHKKHIIRIALKEILLSTCHQKYIENKKEKQLVLNWSHSKTFRSQLIIVSRGWPKRTNTHTHTYRHMDVAERNGQSVGRTLSALRVSYLKFLSSSEKSAVFVLTESQGGGRRLKGRKRCTSHQKWLTRAWNNKTC